MTKDLVLLAAAVASAWILTVLIGLTFRLGSIEHFALGVMLGIVALSVWSLRP